MQRTLVRLAGHTMLLLAGMLIGYWLFGVFDTWVQRAHLVSRIETMLGANESRSSDEPQRN
jgi:hypothetical protein